MPFRSVCRTTLWALLTSPCFRPDFHRDTVFLSSICQPLSKLLERPEVVGLGVGFDRPVRVQHVGQATDIHGINDVLVQSFQQVTTQCLLGVVAATGSLPVQSPDAIATVSSFFEFRL
ncbi:MAG: hypothetical protein J07HQW2_02166 [Haloquadratum walsbyi J07HQW2]|uniref:Uncharacterized protein n=1 Tax=Haloquadratum walsbyi J07HQW2 TaxID=1238425 RepID=U1PTJ5_9EURY|nr:MAG: hypothetical protein J07HQW2_02166 [Haloquadratum walsbyi J07HQW2]